jgi:hypothetical protein
MNIIILNIAALLYSLDHPFHAGIGGLRLVAMERTLKIIDREPLRSSCRFGSSTPLRGRPTREV